MSKDGIVLDNSTIDVYPTFDSDSWNDSEILECFDKAIKNHNTKIKSQEDKPKTSNKAISKKVVASHVKFSPNIATLELDEAQVEENGIKPSSDIPMNASSDSKFNFLHSSSAGPPAILPTSLPSPLPQTPGLDGALSDMLLAWYQSGYATGRYYTMLEQQQLQYQQQMEAYHLQQQQELRK